MRATRLIMGMPISVAAVGVADAKPIEATFAYFEAVDRRFSTYRADSEIAAINAGRLAIEEASAEMKDVLAIAERTRAESDGYFDIKTPAGPLDPSGIVKGWAVLNAARRLAAAGVSSYFVDAGGDIASAGVSETGEPWRVGIRNPFDESKIVKVLVPRGAGVATSGSSVRGAHIYNPHRPDAPLDRIVSLTVIGPDVLEADRFATAAFAMGEAGIGFIERRPGLEGYAIDRDGIATFTGGIDRYLA
ncbi:MAG: FAD:protein FMN transferase [Bauldia sp.]